MTRLCAALLVLAACASPALAEGFRIEGKDASSVELVFDSKGIDRSTAEGTARGLLQCYAAIRAGKLEMQFESIAVAEAKRLVQPLLTSEAYNGLLGKKEEQLRQAKELMAKMSVDAQIEFTGTEVKDGVTTLRYKLTMKAQRPCRSCMEKPDPACKRCHGTGLRERTRTSKGAVMLKQKDKVWLVTGMAKECYRCNGSGKSTDPNKAGADCETCHGTGLRDDNFFRGPKVAEGIPDLDASKPDMSSPEKTFASLARALQVRNLTQQRLESRLSKGFQAFVKFFAHPDSLPKPRTRKARVTEYKSLEVHKDGDDVARINYAVVRPGSNPKAATKVAGKLVLRKGGDGKWRVSEVLTPCWSCSYRRKSDPNYQCPECNSTGFRKATYLP